MCSQYRRGAHTVKYMHNAVRLPGTPQGWVAKWVATMQLTKSTKQTQYRYQILGCALRSRLCRAMYPYIQYSKAIQFFIVISIWLGLMEKYNKKVITTAGDTFYWSLDIWKLVINQEKSSNLESMKCHKRAHVREKVLQSNSSVSSICCFKENYFFKQLGSQLLYIILAAIHISYDFFSPQ